MRRLHVVWEGDFGGAGSIAHVNRELARRLASRYRLSLVTHGGPVSDPELAPLVGRALPGVDLVMTHTSTPTSLAPRGCKWAWMTPWEYGASLPSNWLDAMHNDAAMVCANSAWTGRMFIDNGLVPDMVAVTHNGVDTAQFHPAAPPISITGQKRFRFLFVGRLTHRKGLDLALTAYRNAFTSADDVVFVIKPCETRGLSTVASMQQLEGRFAEKGAPALAILPTEMPASELPGMYTACDVLVHPYRGESFCLPIAEAMACGVPVIATDQGGASMFATHETATLIPSRLVHLPRLRLGYRRLSNFPHWQEPAVRDLAIAMRGIYDDPRTAQDKALKARRLIVERFTWDHSADLVGRAFDMAMSGGPRAYASTPTVEQRESWLEQADCQFAAGQFNQAARGYHSCLGRAAMSADRASMRDVASTALRGLGRVAHEHQQPDYANRFFRLASKLYSSKGVVGLAAT